jgi:predicted  nucleic acid-binding Zn-ribbon protein
MVLYTSWLERAFLIFIVIYMTNSNNHSLAISSLNDELNNLKCLTDSSYTESDNLRNNISTTNKSEDDLYNERSRYEETALSIKASINMLSGAIAQSELDFSAIDNNISIELIELEIKLFKEKENNESVDILEESVEFLKSITTSTIESFKEVFNGSIPKLNEEVNLGRNKTKIIFVNNDQYCFITIPW